MNNKEKYKNTIDKIEIREEAIQEAIHNFRKYNNERNNEMNKKSKILIIRQAIVTIAALLGVSAVSFAAVAQITKNNQHKMEYKNTTAVMLEGTNEVVETIEHSDVENNEVTYKIETPAEIKVVKNGITDRYESVYNDTESGSVTLPDVYMEITVLDESRRDDICEKYGDLVENAGKGLANVESNLKVGKKGYKAVKYYIAEGTKWNSKVSDVYLVDINENKFMVIDITYFMEATEGWATKFTQLLNTLEIYE